ncbi:MAG: DNA topoisomerase [Candidatus Njordarchaeota archaeon]
MQEILIIAEKEEAGKRIASAFGDIQEFKQNGVTFFSVRCVSVKYGEMELYVVPARGHLYTVKLKGIRGITLNELPITEIEWRPYRNSQERIRVFRSFRKNVDEIVIATDFDREGEVIGFNVVKNVFRTEDFTRMYFNALLPTYILDAFQKRGKINETLLAQGIARNLADSIIGLNITKALTLRFKENYPDVIQAFSMGRVQSPLLRYVVSKFRADIIIKDPEAYENSDINEDTYIIINGHWINTWEHLIEGDGVIQEKRKITEKVQQREYLYNTDAIMSKIRELKPTSIMSAMESLYLKGYLTYPRTKSRWIPQEMVDELYNALKNYIDIPLDKDNVLVGESEAGKTAIVLTPLGIQAYFSGEIKSDERIVATYVLKRMIQFFAPDIELEKEIIVIKDSEENTAEIEWNVKVKNPDAVIFTSVSDIERGEINIGEKVKIIKIRDQKKKTTYYRRIEDIVRTITDSDMVKWMTWNNIGTEATRSEFPNVLRSRKYITDENIPTILGETVSKIIEKIGITTDLTALMEKRIDETKTRNDIPQFRKWITRITTDFIDKLKALSNEYFIFKCPKGHNIQLTQYGRGGVIVAYCPQCNSRYRFV